MVIVLAIICFAIAFSAVFFVAYKFGIGRAVLDPVTLSFMFFSLIHVFLPVMQSLSDFYRYDSYEVEVVIVTVIYSLFFQLIFVFSYLIFKGRSVVYSGYNFNFFRFKCLFYTAVFSFVISGYFIYKNIATIFLIGQSEYMRDRISLGVGQGFQLLISHWVYVSCILFFMVYFLARRYGFKIMFFGKRSFLLFFILSLALNVFYYSINSNRNSLFVLVILLIFFGFSMSSYVFRKFRLVDLKIVSIIFFIILLVGVGFHYLGKARHGAIKVDDSSYGIEKSLNGAFGNHENVMWLYDNNFNYSLGATYVAGFLNVVPRSIWPDKPTGAGPVLKNMIYPGDYIVGERGNSSLTTGLITESIMNFGFFGALLFSVAFGAIVARVASFFYRSNNPGWKIFSGYLLVLLTTQFYYAEFLGFISRTLFTLIPIICYLAIVGFTYKGLQKK